MSPSHTPDLKRISKDIAIGRRFTQLDKLLITDLGETLLGDDEALMELGTILNEHENTIGFVVSTGKPIEMVVSVFEKYEIPHPGYFTSPCF